MAELKEMIKRPPNSPPRKNKGKAKAKSPVKPQAEWNSTPHRPTPPALRGLKTDREPWAKDANVYTGGMDGHGAVMSKRRQNTMRQPKREDIERQYREGYENWIKEAGWNSSPFRNAPFQIRGLNPVTREPWFEDMAIYNAKFSPPDTGSEDYQDGTFGASAAGVGGRMPALTAQEAGWDGSTMRYVPYSLRGLKPVTNEPWARDEAVYRKNDGMDEIDDEFAPSVHDRFLTANKEAAWDASAKPPDGAMRAYPK